jgi:hypothetical protein
MNNDADEQRQGVSMKILRLAWIVFAATGCVSMSYSKPLASPLSMTTRSASQPETWVTSDPDRREVQVVAGPFVVPALKEGMGHHDHEGGEGMRSPLIPISWPVDAGLAGFRLAVWDADGNELPRDIIHHVIAVNFDRRQLVYPIPERIFGFGTETPDIKLPGSIEVPLERGDSIGFYAMWNNATGQALEGVFVEVVLPYSSEGEDREQALPIYMDTSNRIGGKTSFDLPPGLSAQSYEFQIPTSGALLAAGGHLHDYGVELRIEEVVSGRTVTRIEAERTEDGHVTAVEQRVYRRLFKLLDDRVPLEAGVRYRVVGVYDNPTGEVIKDGGMAHIVGLFVPDDLDDWPEMNATTESYQVDVEALPAPIGSAQSVRIPTASGVPIASGVPTAVRIPTTS